MSDGTGPVHMPGLVDNVDWESITAENVPWLLCSAGCIHIAVCCHTKPRPLTENEKTMIDAARLSLECPCQVCVTRTFQSLVPVYLGPESTGGHTASSPQACK